jgi:hypothetical protein
VDDICCSQILRPKLTVLRYVSASNLGTNPKFEHRFEYNTYFSHIFHILPRNMAKPQHRNMNPDLEFSLTPLCTFIHVGRQLRSKSDAYPARGLLPGRMTLKLTYQYK